MPMADNNAPIVVGMRQTRRATSTTTDTEPWAKLAKGTRVTTTGMKTMVSTASNIVRRSRSGFLAVGAFDERDHPVDEGVAALGRDAHHDSVRQHLRAPGDGRSVASGLADHGRRFAGYR